MASRKTHKATGLLLPSEAKYYILRSNAMAEANERVIERDLLWASLPGIDIKGYMFCTRTTLESQLGLIKFPCTEFHAEKWVVSESVPCVERKKK